ncbi:MAG: insulinase family protein [Eubacteriales bacterium]
MEYKIGQNYHGFNLIDQQNIEELDSIARVFEHTKSGAKALLLSNNDDNKVFSISFRTPPEDDTGLPHILEHSVLCGSKKFPAKDPFVELAKGSLNTFLNAMTFPDKTMYPVASVNQKDFQNLMHVYMDAVLQPNIYEKPEILRQEGWHYELEDVNNPLKYKGVVYNEMKGAFSSPEQVLFRKIQASLFPETPYSKESGGDPEYITDLTQEDFIEFHKKYYHPSNSYIFLYGDFDIQQKLEWMDANYLKHYDKITVESKIPVQKAFDKARESVEYYSISNNEDTKDKTYLSNNFVIGTSTDTELYYAIQVLEYLLLEAEGAPLKTALIEAGIGKDVFGSYDNSILQPTISIVAKDANEDQKEDFIRIINNTLRELVKNGIDKNKIEAAINYYEFKIREADYGRYPKGVIYAMMHLSSWLYDKDPLMHFKYNCTFENFREGMNNKYFEKLIEKYMLNNQHSSIVIIKPEKGLTSKNEKETDDKLKQYKNILSKEELEKYVKQTKDLFLYQEEPSKKEDIEKIPIINREDINKKSEKLPLEVIDDHNTKILLHPMFTNNIGYVKLIFDTKSVPSNLVPYLGLLSTILGKVDTQNYAYSELSDRININTGGIYNTVNVYSHNEGPDVYLPKFEVKAKAFYDKLPIMFDLVKEIIFKSKLDNPKRVLEILLETKSRLQMKLNSAGHVQAANRAMSYFSHVAFYKELTSGITYYKFIEQLVKSYDEKKDDIIEKLNKLIKYIFRQENLVISYTAEKSAYGIFENEIEKFVNELYTEPIKEDNLNFNIKKENEGFLTSGKIQYVSKAGNFVKEGFHYTGALRVLQTITSLDYLWSNIRVKGGAYGAMCSFTRNGNAYFTSYRDPNLKETLETYDRLYDYVRHFHADERDMKKYIIGTISKLDAPLTPSLKGETAVLMYFNKISYEDIQKEREEVLNTTDEDIRKLAELVHSILKQDNICVIGNEDKLKNNSEIFKDLLPLFD